MAYSENIKNTIEKEELYLNKSLPNKKLILNTDKKVSIRQGTPRPSNKSSKKFSLKSKKETNTDNMSDTEDPKSTENGHYDHLDYMIKGEIVWKSDRKIFPQTNELCFDSSCNLDTSKSKLKMRLVNGKTCKDRYLKRNSTEIYFGNSSDDDNDSLSNEISRRQKLKEIEEKKKKEKGCLCIIL